MAVLRAGAPAFVGRTRELSCLMEALDRAGDGCPTTLVVGGDGGMGKTRLLRQFAERAETGGACVLAGGGIQLEGAGPPYWPLVSAFERGRRQLDDETAAQLAAARQGDRPAVFEAVLRLVQRLARDRTVVLILEDIQWADQATRDLVAFLAAGTVEDRLLLVVSHRTDAVDAYCVAPFLARLRNRQAAFIELEPLPDGCIRELLAGGGGSEPDDELLADICARAEGNPFFAEELLRASSGGRARLSPALRRGLGARLANLSPGAREVARIAAVATRPVSHPLLDSLAGGSTDNLASLRECVETGVLVVTGDGRYRLRHALLREVAYADLLPGEAVRLHAAYGEALTSRPDPDDGTALSDIAEHWLAAGERSRALEATTHAAMAAERSYRHGEALRLWQQALDLWDRVPDAAQAKPSGLDRPAVVERAAAAAHRRGDHTGAVTLAAAALSEVGNDAARAALLHQALSRYLWSAGDVNAALAASEAGVRLLSRPASPEATTVLAAHAEALMQAGRYRHSCREAEAALAGARHLGRGGEEPPILATLGFDRTFLTDGRSDVAALEAAVANARRYGSPEALGRAYLKLSELLAGPLNDLDQALKVTDAGARELRRFGLARSYGAALSAVAANTLFRLGRWREADPVLLEALSTEPTGTAAIELHLARARLAMARGDLSAAEADIETVDRLAARAVAPRYTAPLATLRAGLALWRRRPDEAAEDVAGGLALVGDSEDIWLVAPLLWHGLRAESDRAEPAARARRIQALDGTRGASSPDMGDRLRQLNRRSAGVAAPVRQGVAAYVALCEAELERRGGPGEPDAWSEAAQRWEALGHPYPLAYAAWREAEALLARTARSARAASCVRRAHATARRLGAGPLRRQIEELAGRARIGLAPPPTAPRPAPGRPAPDADGPLSALTRRELQVLRLLAEGHTNRQVGSALFISEKTASLHVSHILAKLGVRTRVAAAALAHRSGLVP